jgi:phosphoribosyl 1,2-cyclic phosphodiesterase
MIRVAALGSGSSGNSLVVQAGRTTLLVDCGFTMKETIARLHHLGLTPGDIDAVLLTHEHGDHVKGVGPLSRKFALPIWCTYGTYRQTRDNRFTTVRLFHAHEPFAIGDCDIDPFPTPHDAAESCQFVFTAGGARFATVTDLGVCTPHVAKKLADINGLVIECNYDKDMLLNGPYPASLQTRIRSDYGHLGNEQAGELLRQIDHPKLQCILLGHLSEQNNSDAVAMTTVHSFLGSALERVHVLAQHKCSPWFDVVNNQGHDHDAASQPSGSEATTLSSAVAETA